MELDEVGWSGVEWGGMELGGMELGGVETCDGTGLDWMGLGGKV